MFENLRGLYQAYTITLLMHVTSQTTIAPLSTIGTFSRQSNIMTAKNLFSIILKILGILFIKDVLPSVPSLISFLTFNLGNAYNSSWGAIALFILSIGSYLVIAYIFIFKTSTVIGWLRLEQEFGTEVIPLQAHRSTILSISVIIIGGLLVLSAVPHLTVQGLIYFQNKGSYSDAGFTKEKSYLIIYTIQIVMGLLMLGYHAYIVNYIDMKRKR
jgi:hypothetical protein